MIDGAALRRWLRDAAPDARRWCVAYSGGVDSHVLLHLLADGAEPDDPALSALHVNHGLQAQATAWQSHCQTVCDRLQLPLECLSVRVERRPRVGLERAARDARYDAFARAIGHGDVLLLAHHQDDQAETVLLRLLRGAGPDGLAGIPPSRALGAGRLLRPLLGVSRQQILDYARAAGLQWIEDPSNADPAQDRNYLRLQVMPRLESRWPGCAARLARAAELVTEQNALSARLTGDDLDERAGRDRFGQDCLALEGLAAWPAGRLRKLLRAWLRAVDGPQTSREQLDTLEHQLLHPRPGARVCLRLGDRELRRYRARLYLVQAAAAPATDAVVPIDGPGDVDLGVAGVLRLRTVEDGGLRPGRRMEVRFRQGSLRCRRADEAVSRSLKRQLQELGVPPWLRSRLPLVYVDGELAALGDLALCAGHVAPPGERALGLQWLPRLAGEG
jgi:tRNA(Ile)-lysidine synthase